MRTRSKLGTRGKPEESRLAILDAAAREFAAHGIAGARTDAIARAAHVNKALLYYYFRDKEQLHGAVLDREFEGLLTRLVSVLDLDASAGEKIIRYAGTHFDHIVEHPLYPRLVQQEMIRASAGQSPHLPRIVQQYFRPLAARLLKLIEEGIATGEFRDVRPEQFLVSMVATIIFYFANRPLLLLHAKRDPYSAEALEDRRAAVLDFIAAGLFADRNRAERVLKLEFSRRFGRGVDEVTTDPELPAVGPINAAQSQRVKRKRK